MMKPKKQKIDEQSLFTIAIRKISNTPKKDGEEAIKKHKQHKNKS